MNLLRKKSVEQTLAETGEEGHSLKRNLSAWDLAVMGVAVAVGAGIFSIGAQAIAYHAGPAAIISFIIAGIVCAMAALCYAEFASMVPVSGSAYTFTYTTVGEIVAWIIGWDLILEMLMAGSVVSKYWGVYLTNFMHLIGVKTFTTSITIGSFSFDWAPVLVVGFFTILLILGTRISARVDGALTILKIAIVAFIVIVGMFYINWNNFTPFIPKAVDASTVNSASATTTSFETPLWQWLFGVKPVLYGIPGILSGAALVFFSFLGFDVVATASEEARNPEKTVPRGIIGGIAIVIVMYLLVVFVTTGMVSYKKLAAMDTPSLSSAFELVGANWAATVISGGIVIGLTTVVMVVLLGVTRVIFAMSRDGLLPRTLSKTGKRKTPVRLQIITGLAMALVASLFNVGILSDMVNIGTLSAFLLVSASVPIMRKKRPDLPRAFRVPGNPWVPILTVIVCVFMMVNLSVLTWVRFLVWLAIGFAIYFGYSYRHSRLGNNDLKGDVSQEV